MSNSPWQASAVIDQVQTELLNTKGFGGGGYLILDESADEKAGDKNAGAGRQYDGRKGKVDMCIVGVFLAYANLTCEVPVWTWIDGELFFQEQWFESDMKHERQRLGIPENFKFMTKAELGLEMIRRAKFNDLLFEGVSCDGFYGNNKDFRADLRKEKVSYMADVSRTTNVYLNKPEIGVPERKPGQRGRKAEKKRVLSEEKPVQVHSIMKNNDWKLIKVRTIERGVLEDEFAIRRVWTIHDEQVVEEWLVVRRENKKKMFLFFKQ